MPDEHALHRLIGRIYDAAIGDEDWTELVRRLMQSVGGTTAVLRWHGRPSFTAATVNLDPAAHDLYDRYYRSIDPLWPLIRARPPGSAVDDRALISEHALVRTELYHDFVRPNDMHTALSWYALDLAARPVALKIVRPRSRPAYEAEDLRVLDALAPHLNRAVRIEGHLATPEARRTAVRLSRQGPGLSPRERDCLARVARGVSSKGIARQLALSVDTINEYIGSAMRKLQASSRTEAVATALALGILNL